MDINIGQKIQALSTQIAGSGFGKKASAFKSWMGEQASKSVDNGTFSELSERIKTEYKGKRDPNIIFIRPGPVGRGHLKENWKGTFGKGEPMRGSSAKWLGQNIKNIFKGSSQIAGFALLRAAMEVGRGVSFLARGIASCFKPAPQKVEVFIQEPAPSSLKSEIQTAKEAFQGALAEEKTLDILAKEFIEKGTVNGVLVSKRAFTQLALVDKHKVEGLMDCVHQAVEYKDSSFIVAFRQFVDLFELRSLDAENYLAAMETFGKHYEDKGRDGHMLKEGQGYVLATSMFMLATALHNPAVKNKMTLQQFVNNNFQEGHSLQFRDDSQARTYLKAIYQDIKKHPFG